MDATTAAGAARAVSATAYLRDEKATFRLVPVPTRALPHWNERVARWAAA